MPKRLVLFLVILMVAPLLSSAAPAASAPDSKEAFLASLEAPASPEAPALIGIGDAPPPPLAMACNSPCVPICKKCGTNMVKLCCSCNAATSCGACQPGTVCNI